MLIKISLLLLLFANAFILSACGNDNPGQEAGNYTVNKTGASVDNSNSNDKNAEPAKQENNPQSAPSNEQAITPPNEQTETIACEFSTQIKTKSTNRANNIQITCSKIDGTEVQPGEEFSFCNTTGVSKESEGYKKADVIVGDKIIQALGGGNCQVSTTLYNAILQVPELQVLERHPHGKKVNYVPQGKDAAVAHGSKDLRFKNNSDKTLKIYASTDGKSVLVKLVFKS